ncbi:hypothetical protein D3C76_1432600 [compost metagenome]
MYAISTIPFAMDGETIPNEFMPLTSRNPRINQGMGIDFQEVLVSLPCSVLNARSDHIPTKIATGTSSATRVNLIMTAISTASAPPTSAAAIT